MSSSRVYLDALWPELYDGLKDDQRDTVLWDLVVRRAHGRELTRDVVAELTERVRCGRSSRAVACCLLYTSPSPRD